ncbi:hypothetical protein, partial [Sphingomonas sp. Leaf25]|uniref:hypothetical protein n=1 Tax=Sphingomonas sp. Leaf25 TaxID=1735692 RepID=UPI000A6B7727
TDYHGLLDLMLDVEQCGPSAVLNGVSCTIIQIDGRHALLEAATPDFGFAAFFPGWYGDYSSTPVHIVTVGEHHECIRWLPIARADKFRIIPHLRISATNKTLCRLSS